MRVLSTILFACLAAAAPARAEEAIQVDQFTLNGSVVITGNTLGRSGYVQDIFDATSPLLADRPGVWHSAFTWIADKAPATQENAQWGPYTTGDWRKNLSFGELSLAGIAGGNAADYHVVRAWLVWSGSCVQDDDLVVADVSDHIDDPVVLDFPLTGGGRDQVFVYPDVTVDHCGAPPVGYTIEGYSNWADVTGDVTQWIQGKYGVGQVPGTQNLTTTGFAGWALVVVVENPSVFPDPHQITLWRGWVPPAIAETATPTQVTGFCFPQPEVVDPDPLPGRLLVAAAEGDASIYGDYLLFGRSPTFDGMNGSLRDVMWGSRNGLENFFGSQIVDRVGAPIAGGVNFTPVDHDPWTGSACLAKDNYGDVLDGVDPDCLVAGARQGWDITSVPLNDADGTECEGGPCNPGVLQPGDKTAYLLPMTTANSAGTAPNGDEYVVFAMALDLPTYSASVAGSGGVTHESTITVNPGSGVSDTITFVATLRNDGDVTAANLTLVHPFPANVTALNSFSYSENGAAAVPVSTTLAALGTTGVVLPALSPGEEVAVTYTVLVTDYAPADPIVTRVHWAFGWSSCGEGRTAQGESADLIVDIDHCVDVDRDGLCRDVEDGLGTDDSDADTDDDGIRDGVEVGTTLTNPTRADTDGDGLQDGTELGYQSSDADPDTNTFVFHPDAHPFSTTNPLVADTDAGGSRDGVEDLDLDGSFDGGECDPNNPADDVNCGDRDNDGLSDPYEDLNGLDPDDDDTDDDGLIDGYEVAEGTKADDKDTDEDGLSDGVEEGLSEPQGDDTDGAGFVADAEPATTTDPLSQDTDEDGLLDQQEDVDLDGLVDLGETDPDDDDSDDDGVKDGNEVAAGIDPLDTDSDDDLLSDGVELGLSEPQGVDTDPDEFVADADPGSTTDPADADTDDGTVPDGDEDEDHDGEYDPGETDPNDPTDDVEGDEDCDDDGLTDAEESAAGTAPCEPDSDGDGVPDGADGVEDHDGDGLIDALDTDSDGDGIPDGVEDADHDGVVDDNETDPDVADRLQGSGGFACDQGGPGLAVGLAGLALAVGAMARRRRSRAIALVASGFVLAPAARAQSDDEVLLDVQRFDPAPNPTGFVRVLEPELSLPGTWGVGLLVNYAYRPFEYGNDEGQRTQGLIDHLIGVDVTGSFTWARGFQLGATMPVFQWQFHPDGAEPMLEALGHSGGEIGIGDLVVTQSIQIISQRRYGFSLGLAPYIVMPTGSNQQFVGQGTWAPGGTLFLGYAWPQFRFAITGGYQFNLSSRTTGQNLHTDDEVKAAVGLGFPFGNGWEIAIETTAATVVSPFLQDEVGAKPFDVVHTPAELVLTIRPAPNGIFEGAVGGGPGLTRGFGTPDLRAFGGLRLTNAHHLHDEDHDGISDVDDGCPDAAEDFDRFEDSDGCPDDDDDHDGIRDADDDCPEAAETPDGVQDDDGCPEADTDGDGLVDLMDQCPQQPEDYDEHEDLDGCIDPDDDGDGVPDVDDDCPDRPESRNGWQDDDGCPDGRRVVITGERIEILDSVFFEVNKDTILPVSYEILSAVADTLYGYPDIQKVEVQGHTDWDGGDESNLDLSQRRAEAVVAYLVSQGVDADRLVAVGYGETKPIADNTTDEGKAKNRRVEFHIIERE